VAIGGDVYGDVHIGTGTTPEPTEELRNAYRTWLMDQVRAVPLTGVDPKSIREETRHDLHLAAVYMALMTQRTDMAEERALRPDREARQLSALAVLNTEPHLALLGDPGSGKSTLRALRLSLQVRRAPATSTLAFAWRWRVPHDFGLWSL
jgi:hypothetical protein